MTFYKSRIDYLARSRQIKILLVTLFALVVSDGLITEFLVKQRYAWESNPFLQAWVGDDAFLAIKAVGALLAVLGLSNISKRNYKLSLICTSCFVVLYTVIIFWNLFVFTVASA